MTSRRLDAELVARGLARSRAQARELVSSGQVAVDGRTAAKPSHPVADSATIELAAPPDPWVGRAAYKLLRALELWGPGSGDPVPIDPRGARCLDVGASTGGFTQVLLAHDAAHVTALDVGHDQLARAVAEDPRVRDLPGTNIRDVRPEDLGKPFGLVVADLSFISLGHVLPVLRTLVGPDGDVVVLVKPQFEVGRERLGRRGVVTSPHEHRRVLRQVRDEADAAGLHLVAVAPSPIRGTDGNREFLMRLSPRVAVGSGRGGDMLESLDLEADS